MTDAQKRMYRFLVKMGRLSKEEYEQIVGEVYSVNE